MKLWICARLSEGLLGPSLDHEKFVVAGSALEARTAYRYHMYERHRDVVSIKTREIISERARVLDVRDESGGLEP